MKAFSKYQKEAHSLLRIVIGLMFIPHGAAKLFGMFGQEAAEFIGLIWIAGFLEFFGGILMVIGLYTQINAFILSGLMAFAYFIAHADKAFMPLENGGELAVLYCFVFLYFATSGSGIWSLDEKRKS